MIDELKVLKAENDAQYDEITALKRTLIEFNQSSKDDTKYLEISKVEIEKVVHIP